jgi:PA14 domain/PEP-CTERM motif
MKKTSLTLLGLAAFLSTSNANPVVYLPTGTDANGALDGTWNAYGRTPNLTFDGARANAAATSFQPTFGTTFIPQGTPYGPVRQGHLVAITNATENAAMTQIALGTQHIGLTDSTAVSSIDGFDYNTLGTFETGGGGGGIAAGGGDPGFRWVTGESTAYKSWSGGEPNDFNGIEDSADLNDAGLWNDISAGSTVGQDDSAFRSGIIEYNVNVPASIITTIDAWKVTFFKSGSTLIDTGAAADALIAGTDQASSATAYYTHMNLTNNGGEGSFTGDLGVYGAFGGDTDDYAVLATGMLVINESGSYQFGTTSDDGAVMRLDTNRDGVFDFTLNDDVLQGQGPADLSALVNLGPGLYPIEYRYWERAGGDGGELSIAKDGGAFSIVGDVFRVVQIPEPSSALLGALALMGFARRRRA